MRAVAELTKAGTLYVSDDDGRSFVLQTKEEVQRFLGEVAPYARDWIEAGWSRYVEVPDEYEFLLEHHS